MILKKYFVLEIIISGLVALSVPQINTQNIYEKPGFSVDGKDITFKASGNIIFDGNIDSSKNCDIQEIKQDIKDIKKMLTEIYYSPAMPGFLSASLDFQERLNKNN